MTDASLESDRAADETAEDPRLTRLRSIVADRCILRSPQTRIVSPKGQTQSWLIDMRHAFYHPEALELVAGLFWDRMAAHWPFQVGGLEMGAIPFATAIMLEGRRRGMDTNVFIVRKERKNYGVGKLMEGSLDDRPIVVVDDILNSAGTAEKVRVVLSEFERDIDHLFVIVDYRSEIGVRWMERWTKSSHALFHLAEFGLDREKTKASTRRRVYEEVWSFRAPQSDYFNVVPKSAPICDETSVYFGTDMGAFWALDSATGEVRWRYDIATSRKGIYSTPAVLGPWIVFGGYDGTVHCLERTTGRVIWRFGGADWIGSSPCVSMDLGLVFIGLEHEIAGRMGSLVALDAATGEKRWEYWVKNYLHGSPIYDAASGIVAVGTNDSTLIGIQALTGRSVWRVEGEGAFKHRPSIDAANGAIVAGSFDGGIYSVGLADGRLRWRVRTGNAVYSTPLVLDGCVYMGSTDKHFYAIDAADGAVRTKKRFSSKIMGSPILVDDAIAVGTNSGAVQMLDRETLESLGYLQFADCVTNALTLTHGTKFVVAKTYVDHVMALKRTDGE
jgi:outer membrane protein assembly factor BamB/orotate phosphoribosyltransferase